MLKIGAKILEKVSHDHVAIIHVTGIVLFLHCHCILRRFVCYVVASMSCADLEYLVTVVRCTALVLAVLYQNFPKISIRAFSYFFLAGYFRPKFMAIIKTKREGGSCQGYRYIGRVLVTSQVPD